MRQVSTQLLAPPADFHDLETLVRGRLRDMIERILEEEMQAALGAACHERSSHRKGYRHGSRPARKLGTSLGPVQISVPRGRLYSETGTREFESEIVRRYERRTRRVDAALLTSYLMGANTRKIRLALRPLLEGTAMSRSAISRLVKRLQSLFDTWRQRDLSQENYVILVLDGFCVPVRLARRVVKVPVQAVVGVKETGEKELLELRLAPSETRQAWDGVIEGLVNRNMNAPLLVMLDGNAGLVGAVREAWSETRLQRCAKHKLANLLSKAPKHCHPELRRDYRAITHAENRAEAEKAYDVFSRKWQKLVPQVAVSLEEAGSDLLNFYDFPSEMWKSLRTTNLIERVNGEFRRRVKTQGSFPTEGAVLTLLFGLIASGAFRMRRIDGHQKLAEFVADEQRKIA